MMIRSINLFFLFLYYSAGFAAQPGEFVPLCAAKIIHNNQTLDLANYKNHVLLIDFWATWCPPCKQSMPFLNALRNEFQDRGFEIIAINVDENTEQVKKFLENYPVDYVMASDSQGDCPRKYGVKAMPSSYFIDRQGKIRYVHLGFRRTDEAKIREHVMELLQEN
jgi:peroxiredoxin